MKARLFTVSTFLVSMALLALLVPNGAWLAAAQSQPAARLALISAAAPAESVEFVGQIAALPLALIAFAPLDGSIPLAPVEAQNAYPAWWCKG